MSAADVLIDTLKNCNNSSYINGLLDGFYMSLAIITIMGSVIMFYNFMLTRNKLMKQIEKFEKICSYATENERQPITNLNVD